MEPTVSERLVYILAYTCMYFDAREVCILYTWRAIAFFFDGHGTKPWQPMGRHRRRRRRSSGDKMLSIMFRSQFIITCAQRNVAAVVAVVVTIVVGPKNAQHQVGQVIIIRQRLSPFPETALLIRRFWMCHRMPPHVPGSGSPIESKHLITSCVMPPASEMCVCVCVLVSEATFIVHTPVKNP